jgi:hypothetical protein
MQVTKNLKRNLACYIAEILLSHPDLLSFTGNKYNEILQSRKLTHTQEGVRRHLANG